MTTRPAFSVQALALMRRWLVCGWRWGLIATLLLGLALRALVPQGFMPAAAEAGQEALFAMVVCTPDGPMEFQQALPAAVSDGSHEQSSTAHASALCSFSVLTWQALLEGLWLSLLLLVLLQALRVARRHYCAPVWTPCTAIQAPRGPPLSV
ncbi:hypothetical protein [Lampropedia aestuarii]|uniref:hypothetical protein n=1 Tax=Lampropedia aestuarii TaxID=2562762 RepID=UPI002468DEC2|nr:hypothetical protein [Lampropedia aestuarii]MDH5857096.1 hypothetical protein [Lampropedia aestuarii]